MPPLNGFPINVPRNIAYGFSDDYTEQDVIQLNATVDHKFSSDLQPAQPDGILWVNTAVRETSGGFVGTLAAERRLRAGGRTVRATRLTAPLR